MAFAKVAQAVVGASRHITLEANEAWAAEHSVQATRLNWRDFEIGRSHSPEFVSDVLGPAPAERLTVVFGWTSEQTQFTQDKHKE